MKNTRTLFLVGWFVFLGLCAIIVSCMQFSYDLALFLPSAKTPQQEVLLERLGQGPGSQLLLIGIPDADSETLDQARSTLLESELFTRVENGVSAGSLDEIPTVIWDYRYLLTDIDWSVTGLREALKAKRTMLSLGSTRELVELLRRDPVDALLTLADQLAATSQTEAHWIMEDGTGLLLAQADLPAYDIGAQESVITAIPDLIPGAILSGVGAFGVQLKQTIHAEATQKSVLASIALIVVLLMAYRRLPPLWLAGFPLITGAAAGLAAVGLLFGSIHGITLAFGFTLLGVAIDYPLHLLSHARDRTGTVGIVAIWPTMRLGLASTVFAYAVIAVSGSDGLAQLGVFTGTGLIAAAAVTRWILPPWVSAKRTVAVSHTIETTPTPIHWPGWILIALAVGALAIAKPLWNNDLSALSPVPPELLQRDAKFRATAGTPDMGYLVAVRSRDLQSVLERSETVEETLRKHAVVDKWMAPSMLIPSQTTLQRRQSAIPDATTLERRLAEAVEDLAFRPDIFADFVDNASQAITRTPLTPDMFADTELRELLDSLLYQDNGRWTGLITLYGVKDVDRLASVLPEGSFLVDFRTASESLVAQYRQTTLRLLAAALVVIAAFLTWRLPRARAVWSVGLVLAAVLTCAALVRWMTGPLNLYHMMALLLVAGLGLDYALFLSKPDDGPSVRDNRHAVTACVASTCAAFGVLATSSIPALNSMGLAVTTGSLTSYLLARWTLRGT